MPATLRSPLDLNGDSLTPGPNHVFFDKGKEKPSDDSDLGTNELNLVGEFLSGVGFFPIPLKLTQG